MNDQFDELNQAAISLMASGAIQIRWKFRFILLPFEAMILRQMFEYAATVPLSYHV